MTQASPSAPTVGALVLAGGASSRMGRQKLLLPYRNTTMLEHIVNVLAESRLAGVIVVTGHSHDALAERMAGREATLVFNPEHESGMLTSVRAGLRQAPPEWNAVVIALGDHPTIGPEVVDALVAAHREGAPIAVPVYQGRRGHPVLIDLQYRTPILERYDNAGLRGLMREYPDAVHEVPVSDQRILLDIDHPEDYDQLLRDHQPE